VAGTDTAEAGGGELKTRIFVSYSRKDMAFADRLETELKARGFEVLIDREEIYAFEDWWKRIQSLVGQCDTVVFVLSPDAVASREALREVDYAASLNKRFAPIVCRRVENAAVPEALRRLNFIFFDDPARFDASVDKLADALQTDIVWIRDHTKFGEVAGAWVKAGRPNGLLLRTPALEMAEYWMASRPRNAPEPTVEIRAFIIASRQGVRSAQRVRRGVETSIFALLVAVILGLVAWMNQAYIATQWRWWTVTRPFAAAHFQHYVLSDAKERALKPDPTKSFRECMPKRLAKLPFYIQGMAELGQDEDYCPDMIVVPAGTFTMGGPTRDEQPLHAIGIPRPFAISKYELTFDEWDACVAGGGCGDREVDASRWGRGQQPVINVTWDDAQRYAFWLSQVTGKIYRLLSEAEYEYAARAGTVTAYPWGNDVKINGTAMANCDGCGGKWNGRQPAPIGSFPPNKFGLYDMIGNVWEWTEDCVHDNYEGAFQGPPIDGSAWIEGASEGGGCYARVLRGGSWVSLPTDLRSANRLGLDTNTRNEMIGFRVARTLNTR
jgi:formylglycine-generating enzyme required for sulfatase activity